MKKISISFSLVRFVFLICLLLALLITVLVVSEVIDSKNQEQRQAAEREINAVSESYKLFLQHRLILLQEHAKFPIMVQTLMQPESNFGKISDFMADLSILSQKYSESLLDFEGNILYSTKTEIINDYKNYHWIQALLTTEKNEDTQLSLINNQYYWSIATAVKYNGLTEGVLVLEIPFNEINERSFHHHDMQGLSIEFFQNDQRVSAFGKQLSGDKFIINWPELGVDLHFVFDENMLNSERYQLVFKLISIILLATLLISFFAYYFGYYSFVKPLFQLSNALTELENGHHYGLLKENIKIKEFSIVFKKFNTMADKVKQREVALEQSNEELYSANKELKYSESQLVQSEKMASIGLLSAGIAHEINNPIGFIKSNLEVLVEYLQAVEQYFNDVNTMLENSELSEPHQQLIHQYDLLFLFEDVFPLLESSSVGVSRVTEIVQSLKTFARVDTQDKSRTNINDGLNAAVNMVMNELKYHCQLHIELSELPEIMVYPGKLNQVFMNLLINAGQAIENKGDIYIRSFFEKGYVVIEIKDNGCGIEKQALTQIFTPFYTSKPVGQGTGLGLSISHSIIKDHDGCIEVESEVGKGTRFTIYLPVN